MDYRILVTIVLLHCSINALPYEEDLLKTGDFLEDDVQSIFKDEQKEEKISETEKKIITDESKPASYSVTELVIDVPDDRTMGPIVTNFSISRPLNMASTPVRSLDKDKNTDNNENGVDKDKNTDNNENGVDNDKNTDNNENGVDKEENETDKKDEGIGKKNYVSILHIKAEFDKKNDKTNKDRIDSSDFDFGNVPHVSGIKEYFNGIKQGIVNGFNSIIHKHKHENEDNHNHDGNTAPFNFFNKIHKKSSEFAQKIHNSIFRKQEDNLD